MDFQEFIKAIFGDSFSVSDVLTVIATILWPILTVFYNKTKNKLILTNNAMAAKDKQIEDLSNKNAELEQGFSYMANMISCAFLSSNTVSPEVKKQIALYASKIDKLAGVELSNTARVLIEEVSTFVPNVNDKKEEILKVTDEAEKIIDEVNDKTQEALDKLEI